MATNRVVFFDGSQVKMMFKCRSWRSSCRFLAANLSRRIFAARKAGFVLPALILMLCLSPGAARAQMMQLTDDALMGITGQSGVSINADGVFKLHYDVFKFSDTQTARNWIELYNVNMGDKAGDGFSFATRLLNPDPAALSAAVVAYIGAHGAPGGLSGGFLATDPTTWTLADFAILDALNDASIDPPLAAYQEARMPDPITIDVATKTVADSSSIPVGTTFSRIRNTSSLNPRWISVGSFVFNAYNVDTAVMQNQPLGSIAVDALREGPSVYRFWAPTVGQGIRFDYTTKISAEALTYAYNTAPTSLKFSNMTVAGAATGASDDPAVPSTWEFGGTSNFFKIGTIGDSYNTSAAMDLATDSSGKTAIYLSLPMSGTVRVENVQFGAQSFGPVAIDDIQFHRLNVKIGGL